MTDLDMSVRQRALSVLSAVAAALTIDQVSKWLIVAYVMQPPRTIEILPFFNLRLGFNEGVSFGMLGGLMAGRPLAMVALTGAITLGIAFWALRTQNRAERIGLALAVGGSLGNITDRLRQGAVTDFLDFYWKDWHWPTFNMADVAIFCGAALILLSAFVAPRKENSVV